jgi:DNA-directed RNA polymerase subunit E'
MSYKKYNVEGIVAVSPLSLSGELKDIILDQLCKDYEGVIDKDVGLIVLVTDVLENNIGEIIPGDPNVFFKVKFQVITYMPHLHELVSGNVTQATDFGAFINIGPFEGLCHVSQVMQDFNSYNPELPGFVAKESKRTLVVGDKVLTRVANISFKKSIADTKIGLTMRGFGLGKQEWQLYDTKKDKKKVKDSEKETKKTQDKKETKKTSPKNKKSEKK